MFPEHISSLEWSFRFLSFFCWVEEQAAKGGRLVTAPFYLDHVRDVVRTGEGEISDVERIMGRVYAESFVRIYNARESDIIYMLDQEILSLKSAGIL